MSRAVCANCSGTLVIPDKTYNWQHEATKLTRCPNGETFAKEAKGQKAPTARTPKGKHMPTVDPAEVRSWARANGIEIGERGRIRKEIVQAFLDAADT